MPGPSPILPAALALALALSLAAVAGCGRSTAEPSPATGTAPRAGDDPGAVSLADEPAVRAASTGELLDQSLQAIDRGRYDRALALIDVVLARDPSSRQGLFLRGVALTYQADELWARDRDAGAVRYLRAAEALRTLDRLGSDLQPEERGFLIRALYNEARTLAYRGQADAAVVALKDAVAAGLDSTEALEDDPDLDALADRPDVRELKQVVLRKSAARLRAELARFRPFPFDFELPGLDGEPIALEALRGSKVTIVDIWGTWCPPCRRMLPHLRALHEKYRDDGLQVIGLTDEQTGDLAEARRTIQRFLQDNPIPYPLVLADGQVLDQLEEFRGYPTTLFLDARGQVRLQLVGYHSRADLEALVTELLAEAPDAGEDRGS